MKICIISLNLLYYITFLHRFNGAESHPTSSSTSQSTPETAAVDSASTNPPVTDTVTPVTLDISISKDTNQFHYKKDGNIRTYTPKDNHVFNKIVKKDVEIWTAQPEDHGLKTVLMGSGNKPKHLAILLKSGNFVLLHKSGKNKPWNDLTSEKYDLTKLKFLGENDSELTSSDYKVMLDDLLFTYLFNSGVDCRKVKYDSDFVWTYNDDKNFQSLKSLSLDLPTNRFFAKNSSDESKELDFKPKTTPQSGSSSTTDASQTQTQSSPESKTTPQSGRTTPDTDTVGGTGTITTSQSTPTSGTPTTITTPSEGSRGTEQQSANSNGSPTSYDKLLDQNLQNLKKKSTPPETKPLTTTTQPTTPVITD
ncbi:SfiI-subtelomeric fragment related protein family member, putative [Theileria annulata]|uniref:SfiI-subtelomeric related protein family member, putative n=1 Tax=Theileria annulata TaxID=5874 RepID=Q4UFW8_THEAN|nr:SfiI-subtelomeric fragment related protein family member, putative [Theileria annulata]CAI74021.1 SfiI-subtelomeric fragment related protein family member, putative [Theileria annulata]